MRMGSPTTQLERIHDRPVTHPKLESVKLLTHRRRVVDRRGRVTHPEMLLSRDKVPAPPPLRDVTIPDELLGLTRPQHEVTRFKGRCLLPTDPGGPQKSKEPKQRQGIGSYRLRRTVRRCQLKQILRRRSELLAHRVEDNEPRNTEARNHPSNVRDSQSLRPMPIRTEIREIHAQSMTLTGLVQAGDTRREPST